MSYRHILDGKPLDLPVGKVVCVGRNYAEHAKELNNPVPTSPILFMKPSTSVVALEPGFAIPQDQGECHHELEMSVLIGKPLKNADEAAAKDAILGYGIGLDLTLRDLQNKLKEKSHPWEVAKAFDGANPLSAFISAAQLADPERTAIRLTVNEQVRQQGNTSDMITPVFKLLAFMSRHFTLLPGDVIMTGTPAGVAALRSGDRLQLTLGDLLSCTTVVA
ncbi:MAG TPA: fumarylacetoacetate hydrolase family protein [Dongiaceae bacterium]|nr:fumarylacetoacetate hydrolase family protein [Dongiaceae bacterium]